MAPLDRMDTHDSDVEMNTHDVNQPSSSTTMVNKASIGFDVQDPVLAHVLMPSSQLVLSMNTRDFSSLIASELRNIYEECFNVESRHMPVLRRRYGVPEEMATAYDDAQAVLHYGTAIEQRNREWRLQIDMAPARKRCAGRLMDTTPRTIPESSSRTHDTDTHDPAVEMDIPPADSSPDLHASSSTRRPRGPSVGKGTRALVEKMGKIPITIDPVYGRPVDPLQSAKLSGFIGSWARKEMHIRPRFANGGDDAVTEGLARAETFFTVDSADSSRLRSCFETILKNRSKDERYRAHKWWEKNQPPEVARRRPWKDVPQEDWDGLCTYWENPKTQERCVKNKVNRTSLKWGHTTGSRSFVAHRHTLRDQLTGAERDPIDFFKDTRCKNGVWVNPAAEETHATMEELRQRNTQEDGTQAIPSAHIVEDVLGSRPGYVKGLGHGPKPSSSTSTMHSTGRNYKNTELQAKVDALELKNDALTVKNTELEAKNDICMHEIGSLRSFLNTICERQGWEAPPVSTSTTPGASVSASQAHDPSAQLQSSGS